MTAQRTPHLVQLVPAAPGGIRDYAENIQRVWAQSGIACRVLPLAQRDVAAAPLWSQLALGAAQAAGIEPIGQTVLIVHYSGYGYAPRGLCGWLNREIADARARMGLRLRLVVMFHELYASGPPWRSAFWLSGRQAKIAAELAALSDAAITNTQGHARWLEEQLKPRRNVAVWPVFSNVGEPKTLAPFGARPRQLVVFGSEPTRRRALQQVHRHARQLGDLGINELVEVGAGHAVGMRPGTIRASFAGRLDEATLSQLLAQSAFGLIEYPAHYMGKSTVFAAYAAHGCVALNAYPSRQAADGLTPGQHFVGLDPHLRGALSDDELRRMALDAKAWYDRHTLSVQTAALARICAFEQASTDPAARRQD